MNNNVANSNDYALAALYFSCDALNTIFRDVHNMPTDEEIYSVAWIDVVEKFEKFSIAIARNVMRARSELPVDTMRHNADTEIPRWLMNKRRLKLIEKIPGNASNYQKAAFILKHVGRCQVFVSYLKNQPEYLADIFLYSISSDKKDIKKASNLMKGRQDLLSELIYQCKRLNISI